ncbi:hypothetical protein NQP46_12470 [Streptomyces albus]|nr:hypothetical protein NQP46_12470 [Streptomyces albus]
MPTGTFEGKDIISAEFAVTMVHTYSSSGKAVELGRVNSAGGSAISSSTNWGNQPSQKELIDSKSPTNPAAAAPGPTRTSGSTSRAPCRRPPTAAGAPPPSGSRRARRATTPTGSGSAAMPTWR